MFCARRLTLLVAGTDVALHIHPAELEIANDYRRKGKENSKDTEGNGGNAVAGCIVQQVLGSGEGRFRSEDG